MKTNAITRTTSGGCGCGRSSAPRAPSCECGGAGCGLCQDQGFVRPRFFPGQLLTEEDLALLDSYVTSKNRLHNRALFGEGVVCGLEVTCHPCGGGVVTVRPGYALDCCGNDLVVPCAIELDINAMVRQLRVDRLGYDCGDPCVEPRRLRCPPGDTKPGATHEILEPADTHRWTRPDRPREYCLYLYYCESLTDPVSPYAPGEPCAPSACEPSRVREGFRFELRCREDEPPADTMWTRMAACFGDLLQLEKASSNASALELAAQKTRRAREAMRAAPQVTFTDAHRASLDESASRLEIVRSKLEPPEGTEEAREEVARGVAGKEAITATEAADAIAQAGAQLVRLAMLSDERKKALLKSHRELPETIRNTRALILELTPRVSERIGQELTGLHQALRAGQLEITRELIGQDEDIALPPPPPPARAIEARLYAEGALYSSKTSSALSRALREIRDVILDRIELSPHLADCALRDDLRAARTAVVPLAEDTDGSGVDDFVVASTLIVGALLRYLLDCLCAALNPPCRGCDDPGVLLACVEVDDCDVIKICNLERTFVLSPTAMRHWIPQLRELGETLETLCCAIPGHIRDVMGSVGERRRSHLEAAMVTATSLARPSGGPVPAPWVAYRPPITPEISTVSRIVERLGSTALIRLDGAAEPSPVAEAIAAGRVSEITAVRRALLEPEVSAPLDAHIETKVRAVLAGAGAGGEVAGDREAVAALEEELASYKTQLSTLKGQMTKLVGRIKNLEAEG